MAHEFYSNDGGKVKKSDAEKWITKFVQEREDQENDTKSVFFGKDFLTEILRTPDCTGISFFFAKKYSDYSKKEVLDLVLVPTKLDGTLIWPETTEGKDGPVQSAYDSGKLCPPYCP